MKKKLIIGLSAILLVCFISGFIVARSLISIMDDLQILDKNEAIDELYTDLIFDIQEIQREFYKDQIGEKLQREQVIVTLDDIESDTSLILLSLKEESGKFAKCKTMIDNYVALARGHLDIAHGKRTIGEDRDLMKDGHAILASIRVVRTDSKREFFKVRERGKHAITQAGYLVVITFSIATIILGSIMVLIVRGIVAPIKSLTDGVNVIAGGDFSSNVEIRAGDEIGALAAAFNEMLESLRGRDRELINLNETLEERVKKRTVELNQLNELLTTQNRKIHEAERLKGEFLANMSHELRTPLNAIIGFSKIIAKGVDGPVSDDQREDLEIIHKSGQHLLDMINDILDISKIESGKMELKKASFSLKDVVSEVISTQKKLAEEKGVLIYDEFLTDTEMIYADKLRIRQIILNILNNAIKFTEHGEVKVMTRSEDGEVEISVSDTGVGIKKVDIPKVFEEFGQIDSPIARKTRGTGLGMAITKNLVGMHGGRIWLESDLEKGTTFFIRFPMENE